MKNFNYRIFIMSFFLNNITSTTCDIWPRILIGPFPICRIFGTHVMLLTFLFSFLSLKNHCIFELYCFMVVFWKFIVGEQRSRFRKKDTVEPFRKGFWEYFLKFILNRSWNSCSVMNYTKTKYPKIRIRFNITAKTCYNISGNYGK